MAVTGADGWGEFLEPIPSEAECWLEVRTGAFENILQAIGASEPPPVIHEDPFPELRELVRSLLSSLATNRPIHEIPGRYWKLVGQKHPEGWLTLDVEPLVADTQDLPVEFRDQYCRFQPMLAYRGKAKLLRFARVPGRMLEPLCPEEISDKQIADGFKEQGFAASMPAPAQAESDNWGAPDFFEIVASDQRLQRTKISRHANGIQIHLKAVFPEDQVVGPKVVVKCGGREQVAPLQFDTSLNAWTGELVMQIPFRVARLAQITLHLSAESHQ